MISGINPGGEWEDAGVESDRSPDLRQGLLRVSALVNSSSDRPNDKYYVEFGFERDPLIEPPYKPSLSVFVEYGEIHAVVNNGERSLGLEEKIQAGKAIGVEILVGEKVARLAANGKVLFDGPHGLEDFRIVRVWVSSGSKLRAQRYTTRIEKLEILQR